MKPVAGPSLLAVLARLKPIEEKFPPISRSAAESVELVPRTRERSTRPASRQRERVKRVPALKVENWLR